MILTESDHIESKSIRDSQVGELSEQRVSGIFKRIRFLYFSSNSSDKAIAVDKGLSKTKLTKRFSMKKSADLVNGKENLLKPRVTEGSCYHIARHTVAQLDLIWTSDEGVKQFLITEKRKESKQPIPYSPFFFGNAA